MTLEELTDDKITVLQELKERLVGQPVFVLPQSEGDSTVELTRDATRLDVFFSRKTLTVPTGRLEIVARFTMEGCIRQNPSNFAAVGVVLFL